MCDMCLVPRYIECSLSFKVQWLLYAPSAKLKTLHFPHTVYCVFHMIYRINIDYCYNSIN
jgi:hypothetical protein